MYRAVEADAKQFQFASAQLRRDPEIFLMALQQDGRALSHTTNHDWRSNHDIVLRAVQQNSEMLAFASDALRDDEEILHAAFFKGLGLSNGLLRYASNRFKRDGAFVLKVLGRTCDARTNFQHVAESLRNNRDFLLKALKVSPNLLADCPADMRADKVLVSRLISSKVFFWPPTILQLATPELQRDAELVLQQVSQSSCGDYLLDHVFNASLRSRQDIVLAAINKGGSTRSLKLLNKKTVPTSTRSTPSDAAPGAGAGVNCSGSLDRSAIVALVREHGTTGYGDIVSASPELLADKELAMAAVNATRHPSLSCLGAGWAKDRDVVSACVRKWDYNLQHAPLFNNDKEIVHTALRQSSDAFAHTSPALKNDRETILLALNTAAQERRRGSCAREIEAILSGGVAGASPVTRVWNLLSGSWKDDRPVMEAAIRADPEVFRLLPDKLQYSDTLKQIARSAAKCGNAKSRR